MVKNYIALLFFLCVALSGSGQSVSVSSSGGTSFGSYTNLKQAFDSINVGVHTGFIFVSVIANCTETATINIDSSGKVNPGGTASYSQITISPSGGSFTVSGAMATGSPLINFNGADNITIDGLSNGFDSLTLVNTTTSSTSGTCTIRFISDASSNVIRNTTIAGAPTMTSTTNGGVIFFSTAASGGNGNDNNLIEHCTILNSNSTNTSFPYKLIYFNGSTTNANIANSGNIIRDNQLINFRSNGVYVGSGNRELTITGNHFYHTQAMASNSSVFAPVYITNATANIGEYFTVSGNYIGGSAPFCGGSRPAFTLSNVFQTIYLNCATTAPSAVYGNTIANLEISTSSSTATHSFFYLNGGRVDLGSAAGNMVGSQADTGNILIRYTTNTNTNIAGVAFGTGTLDTVNIENNLFGGITVVSTGSSAGASLRILDPSGSSAMMNIRYNTLGSPSVAHSIKSICPGNNLFCILNRNSNATYRHEFTGNSINNVLFETNGTGSAITGIQITNPTSWRIDSNTIRNLVNTGSTTSTTEASVTGIKFRTTGTLPNSLIGNTVTGLLAVHPTTRNMVLGIDLAHAGDTANTLEVAGNRIRSLNALTSDTALIAGMRITMNVNQSPALIANNEISLGKDSLGTDITAPFAFTGFLYVSGKTKFYHNSVLISGAGVPDGANSFAFYMSDSGTCDIRNNVFANERWFSGTPATGNFAAQYAGSVNNGNVAGITTGFNLYHTLAGKTILHDGISYADVYSWKGIMYMEDNNSLQGSPNFLAYDHLEGVQPSQISTGDLTTGILVDIANTPRINYLVGAYDSYSPLPVKLVVLTAQSKQTDVILNWSTASEKNNKGFEVQRSVNGTDFSAIGWVNGHNNSDITRNYRFTDHEVFASHSGMLYYRLKQLDHNGTYEYSKVVSVTNPDNQIVQAPVAAFPNPFSNRLYVSLPENNVPGPVSITIYDLTGRAVQSLSFQAQPVVQIETAHLNNGIYFASVTINGQVQTIKIVKQ